MKEKLLVSNKGFTLIELIFSLIILIFSLLTISAVSKMITDFSSRLNSKQKITNIKSDIINNISQPKIWQNLVYMANRAHPTIPDVKINPELLCLKNASGCPVGTYNLTLMDINNNIITDPNVTTKGFDRNGVGCNSYGTDPNCAFKFSLSWSAICKETETTCIDPQVKVRITGTSTNQTFSTTRTLSPFELLVNVAKNSEPVIKRAVIMTNSTHYYTSESSINFDPTPYILSESTITYHVGIDTESSTSENGGSLVVSGNIITYTPKSNFYGLDKFKYQIINPLNGKSYSANAWVWVMTPYTWTGLGSNMDTSTLKNFCGKVKNGVCDGITFPANDKHYIFNNSCTNCNANLNSNPTTIEMTKDFTGTIKQTKDISFEIMSSSIWQKYPIYLQSAGSFDGQSNELLVVLSGASGYTYKPTDWTFVLAGGSFKSPSLLRVVGPVDIQPTSNFIHNNGLVNLFQAWETNMLVQAPGVNFYNLQFDNLLPAFNGISTHYQFIVNKSFTVNNDIIFSVRGMENSVAGNSSATISVKGNVIVRGAGATYYKNTPYLSLDGTGVQTISGIPKPALQPNPNSSNWQPDNVSNLVPFLPKVRINKTKGKVVINDWVGFTGFEVLSVPDQGIDVTNATFLFSLNGGEIPFMPGDLHLKDVYFMPGGSSEESNLKFLSPDIYIDGNMYHYTIGYSHMYYVSPLTNSTIHLLGDLYINGGFDHDFLASAVTINMAGSGSSTIYGTPTSVSQAHIVIEKTGGASVVMQGGFGTARDLTVLSGNLSTEANMLVRIPAHGWNDKISKFNTPGVKFYNMNIDHAFRANADILLAGNLNIGTNGGGNYSLSLGGVGKFQLEGNLNIGGGLPYGGGQQVVFTGSNDSTINITANPSTQKNLELTEFIVKKTTLATKVTCNGGNLKINNLIVDTGTLELTNSSTLQTATASSLATTSIINKNGNTLSATSTNFQGSVNP